MQPSDCILVIFGASGDLAKRKLIPALFDLARQSMLPERFVILGAGRTGYGDDAFRALMRDAVKEFSEHLPPTMEGMDAFLASLHYVALDTSSPAEFIRIKDRLKELDDRCGIGGNVVFYLATPPSLYEPIVAGLEAQGLHRADGGQWRRLVVEKPFGVDVATARTLNRRLQSVFGESSLYRIDHYLGKETVQNVLALRFSNSIWEQLWNRNTVDRVEITAAESLGVENRGGYYDRAGALRDMVQNHLLQLAGLVAMEPPASFDASSVRNEALKVFQSLRPIEDGQVDRFVVRGQYTASTIRGEHMPGYRDEPGVAPDSRTETYVAMKFFIDNWRWGGTPFYLRAGKRLPTRVTEIVVHFKQTPYFLFRKENAVETANQLVIRIQPDEGILLKFGMKQPGAGFAIKNVGMDFHYADLAETHIPSAYERLLSDCLIGDSTLYARGDEVEACWQFLTPVLASWERHPETKLYGYPAGTWGPSESLGLFDDPSQDWRYPCKNLSNDGLYCEL